MATSISLMGLIHMVQLTLECTPQFTTLHATNSIAIQTHVMRQSSKEHQLGRDIFPINELVRNSRKQITIALKLPYQNDMEFCGTHYGATLGYDDTPRISCHEVTLKHQHVHHVELLQRMDL